MTEPVQPVRWGVMGTARIATKIGAAIRQAANAELTAIASRSSASATAWAKQHQAQKSYGSYEALLDDPEIDAVYIPLPPALHAEWTIQAAQRGKHVLCEKPLASSVAEAEEMAAACRDHNVQLMDGVMWAHHPRADEMLEPIQNGTLGRLRRVTTSFTFQWEAVPEGEFRMHRELGGGSLLDLGWYCVGAILWAFHDLPERVLGTARYEHDVDMNFSGLLWFADHRVASFDCGFDVGLRKWIEVAGTKASLVCDDFTRPWDPDKARFWIHDSSGKMSEHVSPAIVQETVMIENFCRIVRSGRLEDRWFLESVATQRVCDALDQSARSGSVIELS